MCRCVPAGCGGASDLAAADVTYRARVRSPEPPEKIDQLLRETDAVAEVHNTLRAPTAVSRLPWPDA